MELLENIPLTLEISKSFLAVVFIDRNSKLVYEI